MLMHAKLNFSEVANKQRFPANLLSPITKHCFYIRTLTEVGIIHLKKIHGIINKDLGSFLDA